MAVNLLNPEIAAEFHLSQLKIHPAASRPLVIPSEPEPEIADLSFHPSCPAKKQILSDTENLQKKRTCRPRNYSWVQLMRRVFAQ